VERTGDGDADGAGAGAARTLFEIRAEHVTVLPPPFADPLH
jgi:hypothetical protein